MAATLLTIPKHDLMNRRFLLAAALPIAASAALAQPNVDVYGVADAAVRHESANGTSVSSGMSQSRIGFRANEDLGAGLSALAHLEHRFDLDTGQEAAEAPFWQLAYVGIKTSYGRLTLGRQYNVLFDAVTSTYPSFRYSPYIDAFKPEMGFLFGARQDNMLKYAAAAAGLAIEAQVSLEDGETKSGSYLGVPYSFALPNKSRGVMLRYTSGPVAAAAGYLKVKDSARKAASATTLGLSYSQGALYLNASVMRNELEAGFGSIASPVSAVSAGVQGQLLSMIVNSETTGIARAGVTRRDLYSFGGTYALNNAANIGAQYWRIRQSGATVAVQGNASLVAVVADYALSKRTDVYAEVDNTRFDAGALSYANGAKSRTGYMAGVRHRF